MMRVAVLPAVGAPLELVERPIPEPGSGEVRVRIQACGVCGSDLFLQNGGFGADKLPVVPGHEAAGVVDSVGPDVTAVSPGDQVALYYIENTPGAQRPNLGPAVRRMGVDVDGAFAEYVVRPASTLIRPAQYVEPATLAVLTDAVGTAFHSVVRIGQGGGGAAPPPRGRRRSASSRAASARTRRSRSKMPPGPSAATGRT